MGLWKGGLKVRVVVWCLVWGDEEKEEEKEKEKGCHRPEHKHGLGYAAMPELSDPRER